MVFKNGVKNCAIDLKKNNLYIRPEFSEKNLLENKEMVFKNGVKNIQAAAYNGARSVLLGAN